MNKKLCIFIIAILVIIGLVIGIFVFNKKENVVWITDNEFLYDIAKQYIIDEKLNTDLDKNEDNYNVFADYKGFGIEEKDNKKYAYMWILEESYYVVDGELQAGSGSSMPYKFTFENNKVIDYEIPEDGSLYVTSIKDIFPNSIENEVIHFDVNSLSIENQVKEYYSYLEKENNSNNTTEFVGTVIQVEDNYILVEPDAGSRELKSSNTISVGTTNLKTDFVVGNRVKITYDGTILTTAPARVIAQKIEILKDYNESMIKSYDKEQNINEPVSNSNAPAGTTVFKPFTIKEDEPKLNLENWLENKTSNKDNKLYYKKVTNYSEYKSLMDSYSSLRTLTESDFENYFAVVIVSKNIEKSLKFIKLDITDNDYEPILNIAISYKNEEEQNLLYSGLVVIMSNWHKDFTLNPEIVENEKDYINNDTVNNNSINVTDEVTFENTSIEGLIPISENDAIKKWEDYKLNILLDNLNSFKFKSIEKGMVKPTNYFTAGAASNIKTAEFEREAYILYYSSDNGLENIIGYVDLYTGEVIGGYYSGV